MAPYAAITTTYGTTNDYTIFESVISLFSVSWWAQATPGVGVGVGVGGVSGWGWMVVVVVVVVVVVGHHLKLSM